MKVDEVDYQIIHFECLIEMYKENIRRHTKAITKLKLHQEENKNGKRET